jgi:hypothetical protein
VAISPDGKVYLCTDNGNNQDMIIEVTPKSWWGLFPTQVGFSLIYKDEDSW